MAVLRAATTCPDDDDGRVQNDLFDGQRQNDERRDAESQIVAISPLIDVQQHTGHHEIAERAEHKAERRTEPVMQIHRPQRTTVNQTVQIRVNRSLSKQQREGGYQRARCVGALCAVRCARGLCRTGKYVRCHQ
jgi:hypothetical protein